MQKKSNICTICEKTLELKFFAVQRATKKHYTSCKLCRKLEAITKFKEHQEEYVRIHSEQDQEEQARLGNYNSITEPYTEYPEFANYYDGVRVREVTNYDGEPIGCWNYFSDDEDLTDLEESE